MRRTLGRVGADRATTNASGRRRVHAAADASFDEATSFVADLFPAVLPGAIGRRRRSRALVRSLPPVDNCASQGVEVDHRLDWRREGHLVCDGRFVHLDAVDGRALVVSLLPALFSGRPLATAGGGEQEIGAGRRVVLVDSELAARLTEPELALAAHAQIREIFGVSSGVVRPPLIGVILSTNRPDLVAHAVRQIQAQRFVEVELRIGLHGCSEADIGEVDLAAGAVTSAEVVEFASDAVFGEVLQRLSERVTADWVSKWDDDDLYGSHHLVDLWLGALVTRSPLVGKAAEFVLLEDDGLLVRRRGGRTYSPTRFLAGGALFMSRVALDAVGGWGPVPRSVDQDLIERFELSGLRVTRIHGYEFVLVRHGRGHTWDADSGYFLAAADEVWSADSVERSGVGSGEHDALTAHRPERPPETAAPGPPARTATVCVPNKDGHDSFWLWQCRRREWPDTIDLVVADDRSVPPLESDPSDARIRVVRAPEGSGFGAGRARHEAAMHASGDVLIFIDADIDVDVDVVDEVLRTYESGFRGAIHAEIAFAAVDAHAARTIVERDGFATMRQQFGRHIVAGQHWRERHWAASADLREPRSSSYRAAVGAFLAIDATTYGETGGFRDVEIRGVEDTEFGYRLLSTGCDQLVLRNRNIVHLGDRTFSAGLEGDEALDREARLSAYVPIWSRNLAERATTLERTALAPVPFVWIPEAAHLAEALDHELGAGTAFRGEWNGGLLGGPFAIAAELAPESASAAVGAAHAAFRQRAGGEVLVTRGGEMVGRFVAVWAANRARRLLGLDPDSLLDPAAIDRLAGTIRRRDRTVIVSI